MQRTVYGTENCQPILAGMARIALNARLLVANKLEGIGWFTHECFSRIAANHPEHQFLLLFDRRPDSMFDYGDHVEVKHLWPPARRPMLYDWWFDYSVTRAIRRWNADVFVSTDGFLSRRTSISQLAVIHDLNFMHHPEWMPPREARYYQNRFPQFASIATRLATVSAYSQNDLVEQFGLDQQRIDVVPNAPAADYAVLDEERQAHCNANVGLRGVLILFSWEACILGKILKDCWLHLPHTKPGAVRHIWLLSDQACGQKRCAPRPTFIGWEDWIESIWLWPWEERLGWCICRGSKGLECQ